MANVNFGLYFCFIPYYMYILMNIQLSKPNLNGDDILFATDLGIRHNPKFDINFMAIKAKHFYLTKLHFIWNYIASCI